MSWLFSQALVAEYLADIFLDGEQSVQLNGNSTQQAYCVQDKMTDFCRLSQFGMTFKPLTEQVGKELLMLYQADFHAKTLALPEEEQELKVKEVECGKKWQESLAKLDPNTLLWKIPQCSLLEDSEQSLEIWPKWGSMRNGECFPQPMLERTIKESEFGFVPNNKTFFHTPFTTGIDGGSNSRKALKKRMKEWPTPSTRDYKGGYLGGRIRNGEVSWDTLDVAVQFTDNQSKDGGQLNPNWVEWLMGWLLGWTDLKPLEMDKSLYVQQQHGNF